MLYPFVDNAKVMAKGQITLPKDIRDKMKLAEGDRVTLIYDNEQVIMLNSAIYAMRLIQKELADVDKSDLDDNAVMALVKDIRAEYEACND